MIISQTKWFQQLKIDYPKVQKQADAKSDGVINPENYIFKQILTRSILMFSKHYESTEVDRRTWLRVFSGTLWSSSNDTNQVVEVLKKTYGIVNVVIFKYFVREKGRDLTQSYDKSPYTDRNVKRAKWQHKQRHKKVRLNSGCGPT